MSYNNINHKTEGSQIWNQNDWNDYFLRTWWRHEYGDFPKDITQIRQELALNSEFVLYIP